LGGRTKEGVFNCEAGLVLGERTDETAKRGGIMRKRRKRNQPGPFSPGEGLNREDKKKSAAKKCRKSIFNRKKKIKVEGR